MFQLRRLALLVFSLFFLSSCGGGGGGSNTPTSTTTEVINGIAVPPEPDPVANSSTIAGVDNNNNGVRDDVERKIISEKTDNYTGYLLTAKLMQAKMIGDTEKVKSINRDLTCRQDALAPIGTTKAVIDMIANTEERSDLLNRSLSTFDEIPDEC